MKVSRVNAKSRCNIRCKCGGHSRVIDSRRYAGGNHTRRRRVCKRCGECFTSIEIPVDEYNELIDAWNRLSELKDEIADRLKASA